MKTPSIKLPFPCLLPHSNIVFSPQTCALFSSPMYLLVQFSSLVHHYYPTFVQGRFHEWHTFQFLACSYNPHLMSDSSQLQYLYACPCLCIWLSVILGKQMVIVIVIVMWERHLCAGILLCWKQSKSVCLCLHHLAYWQTKSKRRRNADCCNWCLGYRVPQSSYIWLCSSCFMKIDMLYWKQMSYYLQCWDSALFLHTRVQV